MRRISILFLQLVIVLVGIVALFLMIRLPLTEGRAQNLDLFSIYSDPFIWYGYATSIAFFVVLYKAFQLLGYIRQNKLFSLNSVSTLRIIKYSTIIFSVLIAMTGLYIKIFHDKEDDPAGFLALCFAIVFIAVAVAIAVAMLEKKLKKDMETENDLRS